MTQVESTDAYGGPILHFSAGRGNTPDATEIHIAITQGGSLVAQGWYKLHEILQAASVTGALSSDISRTRLTEPVVDA